MKRAGLVLALVTSGALLAGCAAVGLRTDGEAGDVQKPTALIGEDAVASLSYDGSNPVESRSTGRQADSAAAGPAGSPPSAPDQAPAGDRMVVYNASVSLEVETVGDAVAAVRALADSSGGLVAGASTRYQGEAEYATLTLKVPAGEYNRVMNDLRRLAVKVVSENGSSKDVTEEFTDLGAQLRNFEAAESQYVELLRRAGSIDEILKVQARLTEVRGQIERTKGRMNLLQRTADMATVVVNLAPAGSPSPGVRPQPVWDPGRSVREAWDQSLRLVQGLADAGIRVLVFSWWLVPPVLLAWGVWSARRRPAVAAPTAAS